jgi:hypothetical protein
MGSRTLGLTPGDVGSIPTSSIAKSAMDGGFTAS